MEAANAKFKPAKAKALKVLDGKSAQNICEFITVCFDSDSFPPSLLSPLPIPPL